VVHLLQHRTNTLFIRFPAWTCNSPSKSPDCTTNEKCSSRSKVIDSHWLIKSGSSAAEGLQRGAPIKGATKIQDDLGEIACPTSYANDCSRTLGFGLRLVIGAQRPRWTHRFDNQRPIESVDAYATRERWLLDRNYARVARARSNMVLQRGYCEFDQSMQQQGQD
jgi:hypothetical protein